MCPICRIPNNPSSTYCVQCGFPLQMIDLPISPVKPPPPKLARKPNLERGPIPPIARYQLAQTIVHQVTIGSDPKADLRLPHPAVSGYHARLDRINDQWILRDLGSRNQTFLTRGKLSTALTSPTTLEVGDKIGIHPYTLVFTGSSLAPNYEIELLADNLSQVVLERHWKGNALHSQSKILLNKVSLAIEPRDFVAVLGGSGAGKSTLLKALSGYSKNEGKVYFNCYDYYGHFNSFRGQVGFVPQSDIIHGELTVETALGYAAKLRIGEHYPADELKRKVDSVIERLDLTPHKATVINNLSGGQRKRVSIAVELLTSPPLFFLDEPTSGLDPGLEADMMRLLRTLSDDGHTIVLVTHSVVNISLCDKIAVLGNGGVLVYYGLELYSGDWKPEQGFRQWWGASLLWAARSGWHSGG